MPGKETKRRVKSLADGGPTLREKAIPVRGGGEENPLKKDSWRVRPDKVPEGGARPTRPKVTGERFPGRKHSWGRRKGGKE